MIYCTRVHGDVEKMAETQKEGKIELILIDSLKPIQCTSQ